MRLSTSKKTLFLITILLILDQLSKIWIKTNMTLGESFMVIGNWFQIRFIENRGAAYGFEFGGDIGKLSLSLIRIFAIIFGVYYINKLIKNKTSFGVIFGISLIFCGALGNLIDSAFYGIIFSESTPFSIATAFPQDGGYASFLHGNVVDMLYFPMIKTTLPEWLPIFGGDYFEFFSPIFNLADSFIFIGVVYLLIFQRKYFQSK